MVEVIAGEQGKGKSKYLLDKANHSVAAASGNILFLDKSGKHIYELNNQIRFVNVGEYPVSNCDAFMGFICGMISLDHDIQEIYMDSFLNLACIGVDGLNHAMTKLDIISEKYNIRFILSIAADESVLPECVKAKLIVSL